MPDPAAVAELDPRPDDGIGPDLHARAKLGLGINDGGGMNMRFSHGRGSITKFPNLPNDQIKGRGRFRTED